jgi:hypothetical protein
MVDSALEKGSSPALVAKLCAGPPTPNIEQRAENREQRVESREQRAESRKQKAESRKL